jgi:hypothetical protein
VSLKLLIVKSINQILLVIAAIEALHQEKKKRANGANDVPTVPFLHVQKFGTKFSIVGAN